MTWSSNSKLLKDEDEYRSHTASLSQSHVKHIRQGVGQFKAKQRDEQDFSYKRSLVIGSAVDFMLTSWEIDTFDNRIQILTSDQPKLTTYFGKYVNKILKGIPEEQAYSEVGFKKDSLDSIRQQVNDCQYYWDMAHPPKGKIMITQEDYEVAKKIYISLMRGDYTYRFCKKQYASRFTIYYQLPILFHFNGLPCRALLDKVIVDEEKKIVYPIDFKTSKYMPKSFRKAFYEFSYDVQAAWYLEACRQFFQGYLISPFHFVVETNMVNKVGMPLCWKVGLETERKAHDKILEITDLWHWHQDKGFTVDKDVVLNDGILNL